VGFRIYNSGKISETNFDISFSLWGNGGPNWTVEEQRYYKEQDSSWNFVQHSKQRVPVFDHLKFAKSTLQNSIPVKLVFQRLNFLSEPVIGGSSEIQ
jgi:hypothetical protein